MIDYYIRINLLISMHFRELSSRYLKNSHCVSFDAVFTSVIAFASSLSFRLTVCREPHVDSIDNINILFSSMMLCGVKLLNSLYLYVKGEFENVDKVLVDIGTGYIVEKVLGGIWA